MPLHPGQHLLARHGGLVLGLRQLLLHQDCLIKHHHVNQLSTMDPVLHMPSPPPEGNHFAFQSSDLHQACTQLAAQYTRISHTELSTLQSHLCLSADKHSFSMNCHVLAVT